MPSLWRSHLRSWLLVLLDTWIRLLPYRAREGAVLVVRLDMIGDFVLWKDSLRVIREQFPRNSHHLTLLANTAWASWTEELDVADRVIAVDLPRFKGDLSYRFRTLVALRREGYTTLLQPRFTRDLEVEDAIARVSGARRRVAAVGKGTTIRPFQDRVARRWYTELVRGEEGTRMELVRNAEFVRSIGARDHQPAVPRVNPSGALPAELRDRSYYVLVPGGQWSAKQWPAERFARLAERIHEETGWEGVVCGGPREQALGAELCERVEVPIESWVGRTTLTELAAIIGGARLLVGNDTAAVHIAAAVETPSVCILSGGQYGRFLPYPAEIRGSESNPLPVIHRLDCFGCDWRCVHAIGPGEPYPCVSLISVDDVWRQVAVALRGVPALARPLSTA